MIKDPNAIYTGDQTEDPQPKVKAGPKKDTMSADEYLQWRDSQTNNMSRAGKSFTQPTAYDGDYKKYFGDTGVYDPALSGNDIALTMGQRQSFGDKVARRAGTLVPNVIAGLVDMVGQTGMLFSQWGDNRTYSNALTEAANDMREWGKNTIGATYKRSNDTWALSDPTWWIDNVAMTAEMGASFALGGWGIGQVLGKGASLLGNALRVGAEGSQFLRAAAQIGTSGVMSYAMGAQSGANVFKEVYQNQLMKALGNGMNPDEAEEHAKHVAAQSAATTAQLTTMLTMGMNVGAFAPLFKDASAQAQEVISKRLAQMEGKGASEIAKELKSMNAADYADKLRSHATMLSQIKNIAKGGGDMMLMHFAEKTGTELGDKGQTKGFVDQIGELEHLIDRTANSEGLLSFVLGAGFGGVQHLLLHNVIPSKWVEKLGPDGQPVLKQNDDGTLAVNPKTGMPIAEKHLITPRRYERDFTQAKFDSLKDAVASDFEHHAQLESDLLAAVKNNKPMEADEARDRMFDPTRLHAIRLGMKDPWVKTFEQIKELDNEQVDENGQTAAMRAGVADAPGTKDHAERAQEAIDGINHLSNVYDALQTTYGTRYEGNEHIQPFVDMVFAREGDLYDMKKRIDKYEKGLTGSLEKEQAMSQVIDPEGFKKDINEFVRQHNSAREVEKQLVDDHKQLVAGKNIERLLRKYRAIGFGDGKDAEAIKLLDQKLRDKHTQTVNRIKDIENNLMMSEDYQGWLAKKGEDGKFNEYLKEANERYNIATENRAAQAQLDMAREQYKIAREHLSEMTKEKNVNRFTRKVGEWQDKIRKQQEELERAKTEKLSEMVKDKTTLNRLQKIGLNRIAEDYRGMRDELAKKILDNNERIEAAKKELAESKRDPFRAMALRKQIKQMTRENEAFQKRVNQLNSLYETHKVDMEPEEELVEKEEVTGEQDGKVTQTAADAPTTDTQAEKPIDMAQSVDDIMGEIEGSSESVEGSPAPATIKNELEAITREIEQASTADEGVTIEQEFADLLKDLPNSLKAKVESLVDGFVDGSVGFSLDHLKWYVQRKHISQEKAAQLMQTAWAYAQSISNMMAASTMEVPVPEATEAPGLPVVQVAKPEAPDTPVVENTDPLISTQVPESSMYHAGFKIVNAAETGATSTIGYEEGIRTDKNGKKAYVKITKPNDLLRPASEDILKPGKLLPGHELRYEVDVDYEGPKHITDDLAWDGKGEVVQAHEKATDYMGHDLKVLDGPRNVGNVPIRVVDAKTGKYLFHIRTLDWLHAKFPGTENSKEGYRNVVDKIETKEGVIDNLAIQTQKLMELRTAIVERYNREGKGTDGRIASQGKGTGRLILNHVIESKDPTTLEIKSKIKPELAFNKKDPDKSMLPDKSLELVITMENGGTPFSALDTPTSKKLGFDPKTLQKGGIGALVPGANGEFMYAPLLGMKLVEEGKPSPALSSVVRAIELYLLNDGSSKEITSEINELEANTGFNVGLAKGLRGFINQHYTYLQGFQDSALSPNASSGVKAEQFLFNVDDGNRVADKTKQIKVGFAMRGDGAKYANLVNGVLDPNFVEILKQGFSTRARAVVFTDNRFGIRGLNSTGKFRDAVYTPGKGWKHNEYDSYNEYVKSFSRTPVYGRNQLQDGTYVYTANPHLPIEVPDMRHNAVLVEPAKTGETIKPVQDKSYQADADLFDNLANNSLRSTPPRVVEAFGTGSDHSEPLTLKTLQEKYNFTPEAERNGRTPMEMYEELTSRGHSYISKGYNPFSRCL